MANTWQGEFPWQNLAEDGYEWTAPVGSFPPNGYALHEMTGNVWEWTTDWYQDHGRIQKPCCTLDNPRGLRPGAELRSTHARYPHSAQSDEGRGRISARRTTAAAIGRPRGWRSRSTRRHATWASAASSAAPSHPENSGVGAALATASHIVALTIEAMTAADHRVRIG
jgi:formylglycine-generating enzyme required for sulfatase activity